MKSLIQKSLMVLIIITLMSISTACSQNNVQTNGEGKQPTESAEVYKAVTIENFNRTLTFQEVPKRAVSLNQHTTEIMLTLGLEKHMVGTAYKQDTILPELKAVYETIPVLAPKYPSVEVLLGAEPDFVFGRESAFNENAIGTVESLAEKGITAYVVKGTYVSNGTLNDVYEDIMNIGRIFNIEMKAESLVQTMKQKQQTIQGQIGQVNKPLRVFAYDSGEDTPFTAGRSLSTQLIQLAGGNNIFDDVEKNWAKVSWEEVVKRDPEVILVYDYAKPSAEEKIKFLQNHPALVNVAAIKNKRFVVLPLSDVFEGVRNMTALEKIAKGFYPEKFR